MTSSPTSSATEWKTEDEELEKIARDQLDIWPLDEYNVKLLNEVHPPNYPSVTPHDVYDLLVIGAGAGGLVSSRQAARRGAKSCMISEHLAGGDCLNVGCVPSKAIIRAARVANEVRRAGEFGIMIEGKVTVDFPTVMKRLREKRAQISPADGHAGGVKAGAHVFQGRGRFTGPHTAVVNGTELKFKKAVVATGGRPTVPSNVPGLSDAPYVTNEVLFNLQSLPPRMVVLGAGVIALEMAQTFTVLGSDVTVISRSERLFGSKGGDADAAKILEDALAEDGCKILSKAKVKGVKTLRTVSKGDPGLPLMSVTVTKGDGTDVELECECLLVATGRAPNVEDLGLDAAGVEYDARGGVHIDDYAQCKGNKDILAVGDCVAGVPRLTHMSGEMAKLVVQNGLFGDTWKVSDLVVPATCYTEPEYATVGYAGREAAEKAGLEVDEYSASLEHNDRAILEGNNIGMAKILCKKGTDEIVGATVVAGRAGEIINEVSLAMKHKIGLAGIGRNIHSYPTTGEVVMMAGLQYINGRWKRYEDK